MSSSIESPPSELNSKNEKEFSDEIFDKHQRFNLRKLKMAPLKRDHSRSVDLGKYEAFKKGSATAAGLKNNKETALAQESGSQSYSDLSNHEELGFQEVKVEVTQSPEDQL